MGHKAPDCPLHHGKKNEGIREELDYIMSKLDENQSGMGRHRCPYCAYEAGFKDGKLSAGNKIKQLLIS